MSNNIEIGERVKLPTKYGFFSLIPFLDKETGLEHIAIIKGVFNKEDIVLTRVHSACATGDLFGSLRCDCGNQLIRAMQLIEDEGQGVTLYLQQEGRGIGLMNKIKAYKLQENGYDTVEANLKLGFAPDERDYQVASEMLGFLNIRSVKLLTNNPDKQLGLEKYGIIVKQRIPLIIKPNRFNQKYLDTKAHKMGHELSMVD